MRKVVIISMLLAVMVLSLGIAAPVLADTPQGTESFVVQPVIGGPNNPTTHDTPADVTIPANNPAIRDAVLPGNVFVPDIVY
jgi:hypothetical protein